MRPRTITAALFGLGLVVLTPVASAQLPPDDISLPSAIPIFPLQDVMLFPRASRPLHIFEQRYREMVTDALKGDRIIGMVMLRPGYEGDYSENPPVYDIGCAGVISNVERMPDGRYNIVVQGFARFTITSEDQSGSYRVARVDILDDSLDDADRDLLRGHRPGLLELLSFVAPGQTPTPDELPDAMLVNGLAQFLGMDPNSRLDLLRQDGPLERAEALVALLDQGLLSR